MSPLHPRMERERKTVELMIVLYCREQHHSGQQLCDECRQLAEYARLRLANCPFQENKTTCGNCPIHCYKPGMREKIRTVMRYAGPRMIRHHPWLAVGHMIDGRRKGPGPKKMKQARTINGSGDS
jgi:hypothetical protein